MVLSFRDIECNALCCGMHIADSSKHRAAVGSGEGGYRLHIAHMELGGLQRVFLGDVFEYIASHLRSGVRRSALIVRRILACCS